MISTIIQAAENFCVHQIRQPHSTHNDINEARTLIAYIDINTLNSEKYRIYLSADVGFIQRISFIFLEEEQSDEETLIDMLLETVNLIVGSAKVLAENSDNPYTIATPNFEKNGVFDLEYDEVKTVQIQDDKLSIAIRNITQK
ncbi:MAG: chemotaxis protein CheX [Sulfurimonas sp.]|nr:chemotaxis protein CheX [Sulfurimonas sp.]